VVQKGADSSLRQTFIPHERTTVTIILLPGLTLHSLITQYVRVVRALTTYEAETFTPSDVI
jgi:hypothetical protein